MGLLAGGFSHPESGSGDTVDLQSLDCSNDQPGGSTARMRVRNATVGAEIGEAQFDSDDAGYVYAFNPIVPDTNIGEYQMKWEALTGDNPSGGSAISTWIDLSTTSFIVSWAAGASSELSGTITVSIRRGTGNTLATAIWEGDAIGSGKGK